MFGKPVCLDNYRSNVCKPFDMVYISLLFISATPVMFVRDGNLVLIRVVLAVMNLQSSTQFRKIETLRYSIDPGYYWFMYNLDNE